MKAFETLQRNRLVRADEHNSRMKSVSNKISVRLDDGKKAAVQATQASVDSFTELTSWRLMSLGPRVS